MTDDKHCSYTDKEHCELKHGLLDRLIELSCEKIQGQLAHIDETTILRHADIDRRLEGLNHLREEVIRDRDLYLKKEVYDLKTSGYDGWCSDIGNRLTRIETKSLTWTVAIGFFFTVLQLVMFYWHMTKGG